MNETYRRIAQEMIMAGVKAADPIEAIKNCVKVTNDSLVINDLTFNRAEIDRILLFGVGKAATPMCSAFEGIIRPDGGLALTKIGDEIDLIPLESIPVYRAYHPEPRQENLEYSQKIMDLVNGIKPDERVLIVFMISGGGSALFCAPPAGISIEDMHRLNELLMHCGATISDINTIRKHVTLIKGGKFGKLAVEKGAEVVSLILSDVVGDDLSVIASGPTYKDDSTFGDAIALLKQYKIWSDTPEAVRNHLEHGLENPELEPPRTVPDGVHNFLVGNNRGALIAAQQVAKREGFQTLLLSSHNRGEAKEVAKCIMGIAKEIQDSHNPLAPPAALLLGGEMIVTFDWKDRDGFGPNREFVLSAALEIAGRENIVVAGVDTDGVDGEGKAGAIADGSSVARSVLNAKEYLDTHNAQEFFDALGDSIEYSSRTNVNDIDVILIGPKS